MRVNGYLIGAKSLDKLRALAREPGGFMDARDYWQRFGNLGNRLPFISAAGLVESVGFCPLDAKGSGSPVRCGYRITERGRALINEGKGEKSDDVSSLRA